MTWHYAPSALDVIPGEAGLALAWAVVVAIIAWVRL